MHGQGKKSDLFNDLLILLLLFNAVLGKIFRKDDKKTCQCNNDILID